MNKRENPGDGSIFYYRHRGIFSGSIRLYVNSWGRGKKGKIESRVGEKAPARFLSIAEEDSVSEIAEVTHSEADALQDFGFVVAALNKAIRPWDIHRVEDLIKPVAVCVCTIVELGQIHDFHSQQPVCEPSPALGRGAGADHSEELIFHTISQ